MRLVFEGIEKRQVFQGIAALLKCCQILSRHTYISMFSRVREVQTGCKLREGWSKVLVFTRKIGFC